METIKVNMTPCDDVQTIHASQNDNEARKWEFELHDNGEVIDAGGITDQIVLTIGYDASSLMNGSVDLGSLTWTYMPNNYFRSSAVISDAKIPSNENTIANIFCSILKQNTANNVYANNEGIAIDGSGRIRVYYDDMPTDAAAFTQAMQGVMLWYEKSDSTPATTPIDADIKYPQGLLTNQEFTYRKSPTEEDGLANIVGIKGQTLKWNQFCCKERYFTRSINEWQGTYTDNGVTFTYLDDYTVRITGTPTARTHIYVNRLDSSANYPAKPGDKLLLRCSNVPNGIDIFSSFYYDNTWKGAGPQKSNKYVTVPSDVNKLVCMGLDVQASLIGQTIDVTVKLNVFNLTQMFGSGNEPTEEEFNALFPFYYPYNSGSLIPFNGNGIKTVGKNQFNKDTVVHGHFINGSDISAGNSDLAHSDYISVLANTVYCSNIPRIAGVNKIAFYDIGKNLISFGNPSLSQWTTPSNCAFVRINMREVDVDTVYFNIGTDTTYESYTESVLNLPISTYFPSGMKSIEPNQYTTVEITDELIPTKATTRVGSVTIDGNTPMSPNGATSEFSAFIMPINGKANGAANIMSDLFEVGSGKAYTSYGRAGNNNVEFYLPPSVPQTVADAHAWFAQHPTTLYFELATPTETSFTTASLVTENGEVALANENGVLVGKCNSDVSADAGFIEGKIKLSDADGDCYSNKIQLHIERSPQ